MKINRTVAVLIGIILVTATTTSSFFLYKNFQNSKDTQPSPSQQVVENKQSPSPTISPITTPTQAGYITGKLCYPSEGIPPGKLVAKNTTNQKIFSKDYLGTEGGSPNNYTLEVEPGTYYVRFETKFNGYYTNYNVEDGTGDHELKTATVKLGESLARIDICDFYYPQNEEPKF